MYSGSRDRRIGKQQRAAVRKMIFPLGILLLCSLFVKGIWEDKELLKGTVLWLQEQTGRTYMPVFAFVEDKTGMVQAPMGVFEDFFLSGLPLFDYSRRQADRQASIEDRDTHDLLIRQEGSDEDRKEVAEGSLEYEEDALHINGDLHKAMQDENSRHARQGEGRAGEEGEEAGGQKGEQAKDSGESSGEDTGGFRKALEKSYEYNWAKLQEYDDIVSAFYAIDSTTTITDEQLNLENLLGKSMRVDTEADPGEYQILIYHTHSQEDFADSIEGDKSTTIIGAGEKLARLLEETYGFRVLHHTGEYDVDSRDYAYSNSLPAIEQLLAQHPSIQVVIDLHRDAMPEGKKLVVELDGRPTAQFMFFNGLSRSRENGEISYLENPYVDDNLAFSFQAQVACNEYYPGLSRRIYLKAYRYNMHLRARCMLVELGAQTNTVEEIMNACDPLAHVIAKVLSGETGDQARLAAGIELDSSG